LVSDMTTRGANDINSADNVGGKYFVHLDICSFYNANLISFRSSESTDS